MHECARCNGEGEREDALWSVRCRPCRGTGECDGDFDRNGDCTLCGWCYDPPDPDYDAPTADERHEKAWRQKQYLKGRRGFHYEE